MKNLTYVFFILLLLSRPALARKTSDDLKNLGVNREVVRKARGLDPHNKVKVVQKRAVDRVWRLEGSLGYGLVTGGSPYVESKQLEGALELHVTPRWSVGGRYYSFRNELSSEGKRVFNQASQTGVAPDVWDFPKDAYQASVSFYPVYGKINLFNWNVTQFDIYLSASYGKVNLERSGAQDLIGGAGGVGFWFTNWLTSRFEVRYQTYKDQINDNERRKIDQTIFLAKIGFLL